MFFSEKMAKWRCATQMWRCATPKAGELAIHRQRRRAFPTLGKNQTLYFGPIGSLCDCPLPPKEQGPLQDGLFAGRIAVVGLFLWAHQK